MCINLLFLHIIFLSHAKKNSVLRFPSFPVVSLYPAVPRRAAAACIAFSIHFFLRLPSAQHCTACLQRARRDCTSTMGVVKYVFYDSLDCIATDPAPIHAHAHGHGDDHGGSGCVAWRSQANYFFEFPTGRHKNTLGWNGPGMHGR